MSDDKRLKLNTPKGIAKFPALSRPDTKFEKPYGKFKVALRLNPEDPGVQEFADKINGIVQSSFDAEIERLKKEKKGALAKELGIELPVRPEINPETGDETGFLIVSASSKAGGVKDGKEWKRKMPIFDRLKKPVSVAVGGGSELKLNVSFEAFTNAASKKVTGAFRLEAVQVLKLVTGGAKTADQFGFDEEEGDDIYDYDASTSEASSEGSSDSHDDL
jgi:hypothetical protein